MSEYEQAYMKNENENQNVTQEPQVLSQREQYAKFLKKFNENKMEAIDYVELKENVRVVLKILLEKGTQTIEREGENGKYKKIRFFVNNPNFGAKVLTLDLTVKQSERLNTEIEKCIDKDKPIVVSFKKINRQNMDIEAVL